VALGDRIGSRFVLEQCLALAKLGELGAYLLLAPVGSPGAHQAAILSTAPGCGRRHGKGFTFHDAESKDFHPIVAGLDPRERTGGRRW
jgi:hypothetical protein